MLLTQPWLALRLTAKFKSAPGCRVTVSISSVGIGLAPQLDSRLRYVYKILTCLFHRKVENENGLCKKGKQERHYVD